MGLILRQRITHCQPMTRAKVARAGAAGASRRTANRVQTAEPIQHSVPTRTGLVHHSSLRNADDGCRAGASRRDAEAGLSPRRHKPRCTTV
jgi:hypothetical protein